MKFNVFENELQMLIEFIEIDYLNVTNPVAVSIVYVNRAYILVQQHTESSFVSH